MPFSYDSCCEPALAEQEGTRSLTALLTAPVVNSFCLGIQGQGGRAFQGLE